MNIQCLEIAACVKDFFYFGGDFLTQQLNKTITYDNFKYSVMYYCII